MATRFNRPPNWPEPPQGWVPPPDWQPDPAWGPAPKGWHLWVEEATAPTSWPDPPVGAETGPPVMGAAKSSAPPGWSEYEAEIKIPLFGVRRRARELVAELARIRSEWDEARAERDKLRADHEKLTAEMDRLGLLSAAELQLRRDGLAKEIAEQTEALGQQRREHAALLVRQPYFVT
jgi:hypothetical protein